MFVSVFNHTKECSLQSVCHAERGMETNDCINLCFAVKIFMKSYVAFVEIYVLSFC